MTAIPTPLTYQPFLSLYEQLFEYIKKGGHSPQIAERIRKMFSLHQQDIFLTEEYVTDLLTRFHAQKNDATKLRIKEVLCAFAFQDLAYFLEEPEVEKLFISLQKACERKDHLYVFFLAPQKEFPNFVSMIVNNRERYMEHMTSPLLNKIHVFVEE